MDGSSAAATSDSLPRRLTPTASAAATGGYARFVAAALAACFGLLGAVFALNVLVDPFAIAGTGLVEPAVESDRGVKLDLIERLERNPGILILGSSRARQAEPAYLRRLTGRSGFNAAVTGGTAADAWVMTRYAAEQFPEAQQRYVWFVDVGIATNGVNPELRDDPRASRYLAGKSLDFTLEDVGTYIGPEATRASWRVLNACLGKKCKSRVRYLPDGSIASPTLRFLPEQSKSLRRSVAKLAARVRANPPQGGRIDPRRYVYFERAIRFMNEQGSRPVIVLNPIHPAVLAELRKHGYPGRQAALAYMKDLQKRLDLVFVDAQDITRWGGTDADWSNATHVNRRNMRRLIEYIVANSDGALG